MKGWLSITEKKRTGDRRETEDKEEMRTAARREREGPKSGGEKKRETQTEEDKWRRPYGSGTRKNSSVAANKRILKSKM